VPQGSKLDRKYRLNSRGIVSLQDLHIRSDNKRFGVHYEATAVRILSFIFDSLPADLRNFVFIDFGSGKGRTLLLASHWNFKNINWIGVLKRTSSVGTK